MVELEKKNSMIQLVPSTPNLQMTCTWGGGGGASHTSDQVPISTGVEGGGVLCVANALEA